MANDGQGSAGPSFSQPGGSFPDPASPGGNPDGFGGFASNEAAGEGSFTQTTHVSWGQKLMESIVGVGIGFLMVFAMGVLLFWNEGRAVRTEKSLSEGASVVVRADAGRIDPANEGKLVYVQGDLSAPDAVADSALGIRAKAARLVRHVEMYQWKEESRTETKKNLGGSEERTTTYTYSRVWSDRRIDSSRFHDQGGRQNPQMRFSAFEATAADATLGAFRPGAQALGRLPANEAKPIPADAAATLAQNAGLGPTQVVDGALYLGQNPADPRVGDLRITYKIAPLGPASFIGRQSGSDLQEYQTKAGDRLLLASTGKVAPEAMFAQAEAENRMITWLLRLVGTIFMFVGFLLILRPLAVLGDVVPFIGSILGAGTALAALALTMVAAPLVIALAWFFFRPLVSVLVLAVGAAAVYGLGVLARKRREAKGGVFAPGTAPVG
ncbi:TMEM43 family protein [Enterovirga rhinocerotis]|uniref:Uncharacterized protein DUF1625 n=1 Tax=Enterovirga rhinocerotis TaxID=1339210 RepID=A0A4V3DYU0_9HYPH|nr:TMEM43 family protein [Enterovirga rhinocerotis]TDR93919.1 uncharacterized protein DUF1625 [Enterovirga rhinocerotis]